MAVKTEGKHAGEHIISLANGDRSRAAGTLKLNQVLEDGAVLERDETGDLIAVSIERDTAGVIVLTNVVGTLIGNWNTSATGPGGNADVAGVPYVARDAEVKGSALGYPAASTENDEKAAVDAALADLGIIVR